MQKLLGLMRRCVEDYDMIHAGDTVAVGVSGGKDSMALLTLLSALREFYPEPFEVEAITIDLGFPGMDFRPVADYCRDLGVPYTLVDTKIKTVVFDLRQEKNPCSMCAKMRRGALNDAIRARGVTKIALGHHRDDAVETFLMSLLYEGRISCFQPVTYLDRSGVTQIRPMLYIPEKSLVHLAERMDLPVVENECPADKTSKRHEIKDLIYELSGRYPDLKDRVMGAIQRYPLEAWEISEHPRKEKEAL